MCGHGGMGPTAYGTRNDSKKTCSDHWLWALFYSDNETYAYFEKENLLEGYDNIIAEAIKDVEAHNLYKRYVNDNTIFDYAPNKFEYLAFPVPKLDGWINCNLWLGGTDQRPRDFLGAYN